MRRSHDQCIGCEGEMVERGGRWWPSTSGKNVRAIRDASVTGSASRVSRINTLTSDQRTFAVGSPDCPLGASWQRKAEAASRKQ